MAPNNIIDFEQISFNPIQVNDSLFNDNNDPDKNFFNDNDLVNFDTPYMFDNEVKNNLHDLTLYDNLCLLHLNIRSINANFENFKNLLEESNSVFNVICLSETWSTDENFL